MIIVIIIIIHILDRNGVAMVTGSYGYYHYMQDKFNDKVIKERLIYVHTLYRVGVVPIDHCRHCGHGSNIKVIKCVHIILPLSLLSFLLTHSGYTSDPVPSHLKIQQTLVECEDKQVNKGKEGREENRR